MLKLRYCLGFLSLFMGLCVNAQIGLGSSTIGMNTGFQNSKIENTVYDYFLYKTNSSYFKPSYGLFLTDKIYVGGAVGVDFGTLKSVNINSNTNLSVSTYYVAPEFRYYFNPKENWKIFGGISLEYGHSKSDYLINNLASSYPLSYLKPSIFVGFNRFLNNEVALEGKLSYDFIHHFVDKPNLPPSDVNNWGLSLGLKNFVQLKNGNTDFEGLVSKGRTVINGNLSLQGAARDLLNIYQPSFNGALNLDYGKFVANGLLVGGRLNATFYNSDFKHLDLGITPYIQYFYPVSKRLYLHGKAEFGISQNRFGATSNVNLGIGATYFVSKNVSIQFNALELSKSLNRGTVTGGSNIGVRYFLR
jgi:hypothetical protein